jgi:hypothetical protein
VTLDDLPVRAASVTSERVEVVVPDDTIAGAGTIPEASRLRAGAVTVSVVVADAGFPAGFRSNVAVFALVPRVTGAPVLAAGPPRTLTAAGTRLFTPGMPGETVVGRVVVPSSTYILASPTTVVVPLPDTLPAREVTTLVSRPLPATVTLGTTDPGLDVTIDGATLPVPLNLPPTDDRGAIAAFLESAIHDAARATPVSQAVQPRFAGLRVALFGERLLLVPGANAATIGVASRGTGTTASDLGLDGAPFPGARHAVRSGALIPFPVLSAPGPQLQVRIGSDELALALEGRPLSIAHAAELLRVALRGSGGSAAFTGAVVGVIDDQLVVLPGSDAPLSFDVTGGDATTMHELQLRASYHVRVRVNGVESLDDATVELP